MAETFLDELQQAFDGAILERLEGGASEEQILEELDSALQEARVRTGAAMIKDLRRQAKAMLRVERKDVSGFERRNFKRWKPAFDLFEMILVIVHEVGAQHDTDLRPKAAQNLDWTFEAISHLHARGLLVAREIYCLLRCGFPDGALARWRTLHELTATAMFIRQHGSDIAFRYLASFQFTALRAARQLNQHAERANMEPFADVEIQRMEQQCVALEERLGQRLKKDYDWAAPALGAGLSTFERIEKEVGLDHWRPRYRWASQHNHGGHRPLMNLLGTTEAAEPLFLVGPSNSGFVDPLHMSAISLMQLFTTFLLMEPNLDRIIMIDIVSAFVDELGPLAIAVEKTSL